MENNEQPIKEIPAETQTPNATKPQAYITVKTDNALALHAFIDGAAELLDKADLVFTKEGVQISKMDASSFSFISLVMPNKSFSKYEIEGESVHVGLNLESLTKILPKKDATIQLKTNEMLYVQVSNYKDHD